MKYFFSRVFLVALFILPLVSIQASADKNSAYFRYQDDSAIDNWAYESVQEMRKSKIMQGFKDDTFRPKNLVTRAEALLILFKINKIDEGSVNMKVLDQFSDIDDTKWYAKAFAKAISEKWIEGYKDGTVKPHANMTRAEWAALVKKIYALTPSEKNIPYFSDVRDDSWYADPIASLHRYDLLFNGNTYDFLPKEFLTRQEVAWQANAVFKKQSILQDRSNANEAFTKNKVKRDYSLWVQEDNFVDLQGTEIEKTALMLDMVSHEPKKMTVSQEFVPVGTLKLVNPFDTAVSLDTINFNLFITDPSVGPVSHMELKVDLLGSTFTKTFDRSGEVLLNQLKKSIPAKTSVDVPLFMRASSEHVFLPKSGDLVLSVGKIESWYDDIYQGGSKDLSGKSVKKSTPIKVENISLRAVNFQP